MRNQLFKPSGVPDDDRVVPITYEFIEPLQAHVRYPDGRTALTGYGVGEKVQVLEPRIQYLIASWERYTDLPLADGSTIMDIPHLEMRRVWSE